MNQAAQQTETKTETKPAEQAPRVAPETPATDAVLAATTWERALEPHDFNQAWRTAQIVARTGLCGVESAEDAFARIMTGRSLGMPTMAALRGVYVIEGKPALDAKTKMGVLLSRTDVIEYFRLIETTDEKATYVAKRRGQPEIPFTFTIQMAQAAGLLDRGKDEAAKKASNWTRHRAAMLRARASSQLADIVAPDLTLGLSTREELEDERGGGEGAPAAAKPPVQAAPLRDFQAEAEALKARIVAAKSAADRKTVREEIARWAPEAGEAFAEPVKRLYNMTHSTTAKAPEPAVPPAQQGDAYEGP